MAESRIPVDLLNPGQVFACLGVLEVAQTLLGGAVAVFNWCSNVQAMFCVRTAGNASPMERVIDFLEEADIVALAPSGSANIAKWKSTSWGQEPEAVRPGDPFPFPDPPSPEPLPVLLRDKGGNQIRIDHWGDESGRDKVKFWTGPGGKPGARILMEAFDIVRGKMRQHASDPFALSGEQKVSLRFDWRRDYIPVQVGFSPNNHKRGRIQMVGFPLVDILAAIGVTHARPRRLDVRDKLKYGYGVLGDGQGTLIDPIFHRAALGAEASPVPGVPFRRFVMRLDWPGREGQARCITGVYEKEAAG